MGEHAAVLTMKPPRLIERLWYRRLRIRTPQATASTRHCSWEHWVRFLPQRWIRIHQDYAQKHGFYWLPCVLCTRPYGGHQHAGSVPDPEYGPGSGRSVGICPRCTRHGRHVELTDDDLPTW